MKKNMVLGTIILGSICFALPAKINALGTANVQFDVQDNISVGETFTVEMYVDEINDTYDGIVSFSGNLSFDKEKVEYISATEVETPYKFYINEDNNYIIAGLDFTLDNGIYTKTLVYRFNFKALQPGDTIVTLENAVLTDSDSYIDTTVVNKNIIIKQNEQSIEKNIIKEEKKQELKYNSISKEKTENKNDITKEEIVEEKNISKEEIVEENQLVVEEQSKPIEQVETSNKNEKNSIIKHIQEFFKNCLNFFKNLFK